MNSEAAEAFEKLVKLCKKEGIELTVVTAPVPQETFEKYKSNFEEYKTRSKQWKKDVKEGKKTEAEYIEWLKAEKEKKVNFNG